MDFTTGKPNHISDYLITVRSGQWYGWSDPKNKIYANLIVHDGGSKPTEKECTDGLAALIAEWELENDSYKSKRRAAYDTVVNQLDMLYKDIVAGKLDTTGTWATHIKAVKDANPKPS
tara:strand:- start:1370 stop:1723 length:354 start_codon:yes stop_codon:yes gene_type:complete